MPTIIICTDFSKHSKNALSFACALVTAKPGIGNLNFLLVHFYEFPSNYAGEGLALASIDMGMNQAEEALESELQWISSQYPDLNISSRLVMESLSRGLEDQVAELNPSLVIIGAGGHYSDLLSWDKELLEVMSKLVVPMLVIPHHITFSSLNRMAFYCDVKNVNERMPFNFIIQLVKIMNAEMFLLMVTNIRSKNKDQLKKNEDLVREQLKEIDPRFITIQEAEVIKSISHFVKDEQINLLIVTPRRFGIWQGLFQKDNAPDLVRLDAIPVLAVRERNT